MGDQVNDLLIFKHYIENEITTFQNNIKNIDDYINENGNKYKIYNSYLNFLTQSLNYYQNLIKKIDGKLFITCKHKWIKDYIDISPDESKQIIYCEKCMLTKHK